MPLLSNVGDRESLRLSPVPEAYYENPDPGFLDTFGASYDYVRDNERSTSFAYNNQMYYQRVDELKKIKNKGSVNLEGYTDEYGNFNYNLFAEDTGLIKTDRELFDERRELIASRNEYNQDVIDRGSGFGMVAGMMVGYVGDPVNLATMGFTGPGLAASGLTTLARVGLGARNAAGIGAVTEAAIQPLVYAHKQTIGSPYEVEDALTAIGTVAITAGILGGGVEGLAGYLSKTADASSAALANSSPFPRAGYTFNPELSRPIDGVMPTANNIQAFKAQLIAEQRAKLIGPAGEKLSRGQVKALRTDLNQLEFDLKKADKPPVNVVAKKDESARVAKKRVQQEEKARIQTKIDRVKEELARTDVAAKAEASLSRLDQGILSEAAQKQLDDFILQPITPEREAVFALERTAQQLRLQKGFRAAELALQSYAKYSGKLLNSLDEAKDSAIKALDNEIANTNPDDIAKLKDLQDVRDRFAADPLMSQKDIDKAFRDIFKENIDRDIAILRQNDDYRELANKATYSPEDFVKPKKPPAPAAKVTPMQKQALDDAGETGNYNQEIIDYNRLDEKVLFEQGADPDSLPVRVSAEDVIKEIDDELEGLESIMRCSLG
tara:strand:- start:1195 stop:3021 length:1827 start_codon:yes stop_codon:yes gene_type:complete